MKFQTQAVEESILELDRLPERERLFALAEERLARVASFYGFEKIHLAPLIEYKLLAPLVKADFFAERRPFIFKSSPMGKAAFSPSGLVSLLAVYRRHRLHEYGQHLKLFFEKDGAFLNQRKKPIFYHELGIVIMGEGEAVSEAEVIQVLWKSLAETGVKDGHLGLRINITGCSECRPRFRSSFASYFRSRAGRFCQNCRRNFKKNPLAVIGCPKEDCSALAAGAPQVLDFLCESCKKHLRAVLEFLDELHISYFLDPIFFKEGGWFSGLIFEVVYNADASSGAGGHKPEGAILLAEGGGLLRAAEILTGKRVEAVGASVFFSGLEKVLGMKAGSLPEAKGGAVFLAQLGGLAKRKGLALMEILRANGIEVRESLGRDSIKSQLKFAEKAGAELTLILGHKEALDNTIIVRETASGIQETIPQENLAEFLKRKLKR